ncbi:MAG: UvrABC system protein C [Planctomycetota bacterium]|nr:MAG: UvrABC system protein C [Planctomycetota bacterium]
MERQPSSRPAGRAAAASQPQLAPSEEPPPAAGGPAARARAAAALERKLAQLPAAPGVYLLLGARRKPIYIGKAKSLRARVRSYFGRSDDGRVFYPHIVRATRDIDWIVTRNDKEALLLENTLIKQHKPRFNIKLVDDKTYLSIKLTVDEPFPRALLVRRPRRDGALYFGPYSSATAIRRTLQVIRKWFPLRTCTNAEFRQRTRPCIQHQMGRCGAPCVGLIDEERYRAVVQDTIAFLKGRTAPLLERLRARMQAHAERLEFEAAARVRDQIAAIEKATEAQSVVRHQAVDRDVFGEVREGELLRVQALFIREGKLTGSAGWTLHTELPAEEALASFFKQFYGGERFLPDEVLFPVALEDRGLLEEWLSERRGRRVRVLVPARGDKRALVELARENARRALAHDAEQARAREQALVELQQALGLVRLPARIACLDISASGGGGAFAAGSVVVFERGQPQTSAYRRFKIRDLERQGDVARLSEVLERYLRRLAEGREARRGQRVPELLLVDGGPAQLGAAAAVLERQGWAGRIELAAIAKSRDARGRTLRARGRDEPERVFRPGRAEPLVLPAGSAAMHLLQRVRDEAHRFALGYHRRLRRSRALRAGIEEVPGIGPKRRRLLFQHFGSLRALREATVEQIAACPGITRRQAEAIHAVLSQAPALEDARPGSADR